MTAISKTVSDWVAGVDGKVRGNDPLGLLGGAIPLAPTNFTVIYVSGIVQDLVWTDNADNELNFELDRSPNGVDTWTALADPAADAEAATIFADAI